MESKKGKQLPPYVILCLVSIVMAFAISGVYLITRDRIESAALESQAAARAAVMENAASMTELETPEGAAVDYCYEAYDPVGQVMGYVSQVTAIGFGGEIEITVGMDMDGAITAISVGGANFSETSGLGAKTRESAFTDQFRGKSGMLVLKQDIDSVTGASVSSGAVVSGVNKALDYMRRLLPEGAASTAAEEPAAFTAEELAVLLPGAESARWMGAAEGIDGWWQADNGYIVRATGFGEGPIVVTIGFSVDGSVTGIIIGDENFMETEGLGARVLEEAYWSQFIGRSGVQAYGEGVDAISGATVTSNATLAAINAAMGFDPTAADASAVPASAEAAPAAIETVRPDPNPPVLSAPAAVPPADAATAASEIAGTETPAPTPTATPDAATAASEPAVTASPTLTPAPAPTPAADAVTAASETASATPAPVTTAAPDAATAASVTE